MKISIIIPVYNVEAYLQECVDSVLHQTYQNFEMILVDDGSPDSCPEICDRLSQVDSRIITIHKENGGLSDARNVGIASATGEYVIFLDSDDYWDDNTALEQLVERAKKTNPDVLNYAYKKVRDGRNIAEKNLLPPSMPIQLDVAEAQLEYLFFNGLYIASACNKMVRKDIFQQGLLFQIGDTSEDVEWCAELLAKAKRFDYVSLCFYCYRQREGSITHSIKTKNCEDSAKHIRFCVALSKTCPKEIRKYLLVYAAYQLAVFVITQSYAEIYQRELIDEMSGYTGLFAFCGKNAKVRAVKYSTMILGYKNLCRIIRFINSPWRIK